MQTTAQMIAVDHSYRMSHCLHDLVKDSMERNEALQCRPLLTLPLQTMQMGAFSARWGLY
eukprot:3429563-Rhodomonas_salina.1